MHTPGSPTSPDAASDIRLVVADMDGTLLDEHGAVPDGFWPLLERLQERNIVFAPASGRQYPALADFFGHAAAGLAIIAENGAYVARDGVEVSSSTVGRDVVERVVGFIRDLTAPRDMGLVLSGRDCAYVERNDERFVNEAGRFYTSLTVVDDLLAVPEAPLKFAVHDFVGASGGGRDLLATAFTPFQVVMSSEHWYDIMDPAVDKGVAVRALRHALGVHRDQTIVFGDYLNDLAMMAEATHSYAMSNAHPRVIEASRHLAPSNREHGVVTTLTEVLRAGQRAQPA